MHVCGVAGQQHPSLAAGSCLPSPFQAEPESKVVQVQRIIRDTRLSVESVYYPLLRQLLAALPGEEAYITLDQTNQGKLFKLVLVGWASNGVSLPLGFVVYPSDGSWAKDARALLDRLDQIIPVGRTITLLADRVQAGEPFRSCLVELGWN
jgi:hypothetical protein